MEANQDPTILEEDVLEDMEVLEEATPEMTEEEEKEPVTEMGTETATVDVVDGNTVKLKDLNL